MALPNKLIRVAWMAIVLGVVMQVLSLVAGASASALVRDTILKITWSSLVCFAVAVGTAAASQMRPAAMGLAGFFAAPAAFAIVRALQKAFSTASGAASGQALAVVLLVALIKAAEYGCFGMITGWLTTERFPHAWPYVTVGALVGLFFGGMTSIVLAAGSAANPLPLLVNEVLFPMGCALVLFLSGLLRGSQA